MLNIWQKKAESPWNIFYKSQQLVWQPFTNYSRNQKKLSGNTWKIFKKKKILSLYKN